MVKCCNLFVIFLYEGDLVTGELAISILGGRNAYEGSINYNLRLRLFWNDPPLYGKFMVAHLRNNFDHTFLRSSRSVAWQEQSCVLSAQKNLIEMVLLNTHNIYV